MNELFLERLKDKVAINLIELYKDEPMYADDLVEDLNNTQTYVEVLKVMSTTWSEKDSYWYVHNTIMDMSKDSTEEYSKIVWPEYT